LIFEDIGYGLNRSSKAHFWDSHWPIEGKLSSLSFN